MAMIKNNATAIQIAADNEVPTPETNETKPVPKPVRK
jgi:hypothetical protein